MSNPPVANFAPQASASEITVTDVSGRPINLSAGAPLPAGTVIDLKQAPPAPTTPVPGTVINLGASSSAPPVPVTPTVVQPTVVVAQPVVVSPTSAPTPIVPLPPSVTTPTSARVEAPMPTTPVVTMPTPMPAGVPSAPVISGGDMAGNTGIFGAPQPPPPLSPIDVSTMNAPSSEQPVMDSTFPGGSVSNPTPPRPTVVVPPTIGSQPITPFPPPSATTSSSGSFIPSSGTVVPPSAAPISTPAPSTRPAQFEPQAPPAPPTFNGYQFADFIRMAVQRNADEEAAKKAQANLKVDDDVVKEMRQRLFGDIHELYERVSVEIKDSAAVSGYCLDLLKKARQAILVGTTAGELSEAEFQIETVRAKLGRSKEVVPPGQRGAIVRLMSYQIFFGVISALMVAVPWLASDQLLQLIPMLDRTMLVLGTAVLGALGWGGIGGVVGTLYNLPWFVQKRDYDPSFNLSYYAAPIKGFFVGGVLFLMLNSGVASLGSAPQTGGASPNSFLFSYVFSFLGGFKQEYIFEWFDSILKAALRTPPKIGG